MTLLELLLFLFIFGCGVAAGTAGHAIGGTWLAVVGFTAGTGAIPLIAMAYNRYRKWAYKGDYWMPPCSCGSTNLRNEKTESEYWLLCQECRTRYQKRGDQAFVFDGSKRKPFKRLVKHKGWV